MLDSINLLPWRDAHRKKQYQRFLIKLAITAFFVLLLGSFYMHHLQSQLKTTRIDIQTHKNIITQYKHAAEQAHKQNQHQIELKNITWLA